MPILAGFLMSILGSFIAFFTKYFTKRIAVFTAVLTAVTLLTVTFWAALYGLISGVSLAIPTSMQPLLGILPSNTEFCISVIFTARIASYVYSWNAKIWQWKLAL